MLSLTLLSSALAGSVVGTVTTTSAASSGVLPVTQDGAVCGATAPVEAVVARGGKLQNAVVFVDGIVGATVTPMDGTLDQKTCRYVPHVQALTVGSTLTVVNSDDVLHNAHSTLEDDRTVFNLAMPMKDQRIPKSLRKAGLMTVGCDAGHTWMSAYVYVFDHPYFAVTDAAGAYRIEGLPAGKHTVSVWHEKLGTKTQTVEVPAGGEVTATFDL